MSLVKSIVMVINLCVATNIVQSMLFLILFVNENVLPFFKHTFFLFQLTNKSWCRALGWRPDEGPRPLSEAAGGEALRLAASGAREWEAPITLRRRAAPDQILLPCRGAAIGLTRQVSDIHFHTLHIFFMQVTTSRTFLYFTIGLGCEIWRKFA